MFGSPKVSITSPGWMDAAASRVGSSNISPVSARLQASHVQGQGQSVEFHEQDEISIESIPDITFERMATLLQHNAQLRAFLQTETKCSAELRDLVEQGKRDIRLLELELHTDSCASTSEQKLLNVCNRISQLSNFDALFQVCLNDF